MDSTKKECNFSHADEQRKIIIERHVIEASRSNSLSKKKLLYEIDPGNFQNQFWDNENIIEYVAVAVAFQYQCSR